VREAIAPTRWLRKSERQSPSSPPASWHLRHPRTLLQYTSLQLAHGGHFRRRSDTVSCLGYCGLTQEVRHNPVRDPEPEVQMLPAMISLFFCREWMTLLFRRWDDCCFPAVIVGVELLSQSEKLDHGTIDLSRSDALVTSNLQAEWIRLTTLGLGFRVDLAET